MPSTIININIDSYSSVLTPIVHSSRLMVGNLKTFVLSWMSLRAQHSEPLMTLSASSYLVSMAHTTNRARKAVSRKSGRGTNYKKLPPVTPPHRTPYITRILAQSNYRITCKALYSTYLGSTAIPKSSWEREVNLSQEHKIDASAFHVTVSLYFWATVTRV